MVELTEETRVELGSDRSFGIVFAIVFAMLLKRRKQFNSEIRHDEKKTSRNLYHSFKTRPGEITLGKAENLSAARAQSFNSTRVSEFYAEDVGTSKKVDLIIS